MKNAMRIGLAALAGLLVPGADAVESNAVSVDLQDGVNYLESGTLTVPIDWNGGLVPADAASATLTVKGSHVNVSATATKPAASIACTLFDDANPPTRFDSLTATLTFLSADGKRLSENMTTTYEVRPATFARGRVLTCAETANAWRYWTAPADVPFDTKWYPNLQGANLTWAAISNLTTGVNISGSAPLNGAGKPVGYVPFEKKDYPSGKWYLKMYSGNDLIDSAWLDGVLGMMLIIR